MGLTQQICDEILGKLSTGLTIEVLAEEYKISTGIIELIRLGKCRLENGVSQIPIDHLIHINQGKPHVRTKCTSEEIDEIVERYTHGETKDELAKDFAVSRETIRKYMEKRGAERGKYNTEDIDPNLRNFLIQVRKVLFRQDRGTDKRKYNEWRGKTYELYKTGDYLKHECQIMAAHEFECCRTLFEKYDVSMYDPLVKTKDTANGTTSPEVGNRISIPERPVTKRLEERTVECDGKELTYRENLTWAAEAAGNERRTSIPPDKCPNDTAYWLYTQARDASKEFMSKLSAIEVRNVNPDDAVGRRAAKRSIEDIDVMLKELVVEE